MGIKRLAWSFDLWVRSLSSSLIKSCLWTLLLFIRARLIHHPTHPQSSPYNLGKTPFWLSGWKIAHWLNLLTLVGIRRICNRFATLTSMKILDLKVTSQSLLLHYVPANF